MSQKGREVASTQVASSLGMYPVTHYAQQRTRQIYLEVSQAFMVVDTTQLERYK